MGDWPALRAIALSFARSRAISKLVSEQLQTMTLIKLYRASIHVLIFIAGSRLLAAAQMDRSEALTLLLAAYIVSTCAKA